MSRRDGPKRRWGLGLLTSLMMLAMAASAPTTHAVEWTLIPSLWTTVEYNDNIRRRLEDENVVPVTGLRIRPKLETELRDPNWSVSATGEVDIQRYTGEEEDDLDRTNGALEVTSAYRLARMEWGLDGLYEIDTTLRDVQDQIDPDIGVVTQQLQRTTTQVTPSWDWQVTPRMRLETIFQHQSVAVEEIEEIGLSDFNNDSLHVSLTREMTTRLTLLATVDYSRFRVEDQRLQTLVLRGGLPVAGEVKLEGSQADTIAARVGGSYRFSPTLSGEVSAGLRQSRTEFEVPSRSGDVVTGVDTETATSVGAVARAGLTKQFERARLDLSASREVTPSLAGRLTQTDTIRLGVHRDLTQRLKADLRVDYIRIQFDTTPQETTFRDRTLLHLKPGLRWKVSQRWSVIPLYDYQRIDRTGEVAKRNRFRLLLSYRGQKVRLRH